MHSIDYRHPGQLTDGPVLIVGAANSGVEIALDLARTHEVMVAGNSPGAIPFDIEGFLGRKLLVRLVLRGVFHRLFSVRNPVGRKARSKLMAKGKPLVRSKPSDLAAAGVKTVPRITGVEGGLPLTVDGRRLDVANIVWATGFRPGFGWIDLDVGGDDPRHELGVVEDSPGLFFVGLDFTSAASSGQIHGVGRDAARIATAIARRVATRRIPVQV
jgi:putative flavoprotein involved in K+ transport